MRCVTCEAFGKSRRCLHRRWTRVPRPSSNFANSGCGSCLGRRAAFGVGRLARCSAGRCAGLFRHALQDVEAQELLAFAATRLARVQVPSEVAVGGAMARLTALRKHAQTRWGRARYRNGDVFRRMVARTLAKQWATTVDQATRAGRLRHTERCGRRVARWPRRLRQHLTGRVSRQVAGLAPPLLPLVRLFFGQLVGFRRTAPRDAARRRVRTRGSAGPCAFRTGAARFPGSSSSVAASPADDLVAFLDALYVTTVPSRARASLDAAKHGGGGVRHVRPTKPVPLNPLRCCSTCSCTCPSFQTSSVPGCFLPCAPLHPGRRRVGHSVGPSMLQWRTGPHGQTHCPSAHQIAGLGHAMC